MTILVTFGEVVSLVLTAALMVLFAKAHGRQVRLQRELRGYSDADFMSDENPAWVEELWKRDRQLFWSVFVFVAALELVARFVFEPAPLPLPFAGPGLREAWWDALVILGWALSAAFGVAGLAGLISFRTDARSSEARRDAAWIRGADRGSALWWGLALGCGAIFWIVGAAFPAAQAY